MASSSDSLSLPFDSIDDLIYFARVGDLAELQTTIKTLTTSHSSTPGVIISSAIDIDPSDPDSSSECSLLHWAAANNHIDVLRYLLTSIDGAPFTKQEIAHTNGDSSTSKTFKPRKGGLVNVQNSSGNTALHWAALNGNLECVELLVQAGADPSIRNSAGKDAVFEAERGELNKDGGGQETTPDGEDDKKKAPGVVEWLLDNCEGLDKGVGGSTEGETSESVPDAESSMNVDG